MRPTSLKTSDHKSMLAYLGLPLDLFGKVGVGLPISNAMCEFPNSQDAFFQPYLPLQQLDMIKESKSWLCGTTNSIVGEQKEVDLFVDVSPIGHTPRHKSPRLLILLLRQGPGRSSFEILNSKSLPV